MDGQGADELLAGYRHYHIHLIFDLLLNFRIKDAFVVLTDAIGEGLIGVLTMALRNSLNAAGKKLMRIFFGYEACFEASFREKLSSGSVSLEKVQPQEQKSGIFHNYLMRQHKIGLRNLLYYGDILAMKSSIENRSPFMDHRLVDLAFSVSSQLHVSGAKDKSVLRKHPIYSRFKKQLERKKIGFNSPINASIRLAMAEELSSSEILKWPIFARHRLMRLLVDGPITSQKFERFLFRLYQVHLWNLEFLKR